uniref:helix-turn-helix domain-containing protein n=1 Tax=Candidatus Enterococcus willemsii TaxID=1857215 RepID=UPI00403F09FF
MSTKKENTDGITRPDKKTYTVDEIAMILKISNKAAYSLIKKKKFHSIRVGRLIRISKSSFDEWLNPQSFKER